MENWITDTSHKIAESLRIETSINCAGGGRNVLVIDFDRIVLLRLETKCPLAPKGLLDRRNTNDVSLKKDSAWHSTALGKYKLTYTSKLHVA